METFIDNMKFTFTDNETGQPVPSQFMKHILGGVVSTLAPPQSSKRELPQPRHSGIQTDKVIASLIEHKKYKGVKEGTVDTYLKRLSRFEREFPFLPDDLATIMNYLSNFAGETGRNRRNHQDCLAMLFEHAVRFFDLPRNPLSGLNRPRVIHKPIKTLTLDEIGVLDSAPKSLTERVALDLLIGHGWRQIEVRRIVAADVFSIRGGIMFCRGKEREEMAPLLPETVGRLQELAEGLSPADHVIRSQLIYHGRRRALGEDGISQLIERLYAKAGITGFTGHDLRRSFATLVREASNDEFLAMRLLRDKVPGQSDRYINFPLSRLKEALVRYSPLRLVRDKETGSGTNPEPVDSSGGDGGELNSPSKRSCPEYTTSLVSALISPG
jgi:integrase